MQRAPQPVRAGAHPHVGLRSEPRLHRGGVMHVFAYDDES
jgi:hypothetical protein